MAEKKRKKPGEDNIIKKGVDRSKTSFEPKSEFVEFNYDEILLEY